MKRCWSIRHVRYVWHAYWCAREAQMWGKRGIGLGVPHEADIVTLDGIWEGRW
jgi:hypothetical protein